MTASEISESAARFKASRDVPRNPGSGGSTALAKKPTKKYGVTVSEFVGETRQKARVSAASAFKRAFEEWVDMRSSGQVTGMRGRHFAALYYEAHESVYGEAPRELLDGDTWYGAASAAEKALRDEFRGNVMAMVEYVRWAWKRERAAEKKRRADHQDGRRLGWRLLYQQRHLVTDYRIALRRGTA